MSNELMPGSEATSSSLVDWARHALARDDLGRVKLSDAYREYCAWAQLPAWPDYRGISSRSFARALVGVYGPSVQRVKSSGTWIAGLRWRTPKELAADACI